jgi:hypothetical protein
MASASENFFESAGLTRWGREPGFVAPKPLTARQIRKRRDALDNAESAVSDMWSRDRGTYSFSPDSVTFKKFEALMHRRHVAEIAYGSAITDRNLYLRVKAENRKTTPTQAAGIKLRDKMYAAEDHLDEIIAARPEFATVREFIDANAAFVLAMDLYDIAERQFQDRQRQSRADKRANINRR